MAERRKTLEKQAKKKRKKLLEAAGKHETAGPMAMQPPREGDVTDSRRDQPGATPRLQSGEEIESEQADKPNEVTTRSATLRICPSLAIACPGEF